MLFCKMPTELCFKGSGFFFTAGGRPFFWKYYSNLNIHYNKKKRNTLENT